MHPRENLFWWIGSTKHPNQNIYITLSPIIPKKRKICQQKHERPACVRLNLSPQLFNIGFFCTYLYRIKKKEDEPWEMQEYSNVIYYCTSCQLRVASCQLRVGEIRMPVDEIKMPVDEIRMPVGEIRMPVDAFEMPVVISCQLRVASCQLMK